MIVEYTLPEIKGEKPKRKQSRWIIGTTYVSLFIICFISIYHSESVAGIIHSHSTSYYQRQVDKEKIQRILERKILKQKLMDYGVSPISATKKIELMNNKDLHNLSLLIDRVPEGAGYTYYPGLYYVIILAIGLVVVVTYLIYFGVKYVVPNSNSNVTDNNVKLNYQ
jgi:hypothetical protein